MSYLVAWRLILSCCFIGAGDCSAFVLVEPWMRTTTVSPKCTRRWLLSEKSEDDAAIRSFYDFMDELGWEKGRETSRISNHDGSGQDRRGVVARRNLLKGEAVLRIPRDAAIVLEDDETTLSQRAVALLDCQKNLPQYEPYWNILPTRQSNFDPTPDLWPAEQVKALELPELIEEVMERQEHLQSFKAATPYEFDSLCFAHWLVTSRSFSILQHSIEDEKDAEDFDEEDELLSVQSVLIPYIDMINHSSDSPNVVLEINENNDSFELVAVQDISKEEELVLSYGTTQEESMDLLLNYGFVPKRNPWDLDALEDDEFEWTTSLEDNLRQLPKAQGIQRTILSLRIKLQHAMMGIDKIDN